MCNVMWLDLCGVCGIVVFFLASISERKRDRESNADYSAVMHYYFVLSGVSPANLRTLV